MPVFRRTLLSSTVSIVAMDHVLIDTLFRCMHCTLLYLYEYEDSTAAVVILCCTVLHCASLLRTTPQICGDSFIIHPWSGWKCNLIYPLYEYVRINILSFRACHRGPSRLSNLFLRHVLHNFMFAMLDGGSLFFSIRSLFIILVLRA